MKPFGHFNSFYANYDVSNLSNSKFVVELSPLTLVLSELEAPVFDSAVGLLPG